MVEENFYGVISQGIDVMLMVVCLDNWPSVGFEVQEYRRLADGDRANLLKRQ